MSHAIKSMEISHTASLFRLPCLSNPPQITWVYSAPVCKYLKNFADQPLANIVAELIQRLPHIPTGVDSLSARTPAEQQIIQACVALAAGTVFAPANLYYLKANILQPLHFYHPSANIELTDLLQIGMEILSEPYKQEHPLRLFQGFELQQRTKNNLSITDLQLWLKKKFLLLLIDRIRQYDGAKDFKRTNIGLLKRTSQVKMREALNQMGLNHQIPAMLTLHRVLCDARQEFYSPQPQTADYQRLNDLYQSALVVRKLPTCTLSQTQSRLTQLGLCIRSYGNSRMRSLQEVVGENSSELIDLFSDHHYDSPLDNCLLWERQEQTNQLKAEVYQQLKDLPSVQLESFWLKASGHNDSKIARMQRLSCASSTIKRRRDRVISNALNISIQDRRFPKVADAYLEIVQEFFEFFEK
jgi:hypothetical protein